jgi:uncharacterized membrane protein YhaH (DUF805 family)
MNYQSVFASPMGRTSRGAFIAALIILILVVAFYVFLVHAGRNGEWVLVTLLYPGVVLHARRLHDMGKTAWLLLLPVALILAAVWMHMTGWIKSGGSERVQDYVGLAAHVVGAGFVLWCLIGKGQAEANRFGAAA